MKTKLLAMSMVFALSACSSTKSVGGPFIHEQKLATKFVSEQIKVETKCSWFGLGSDCEVVAIEAVGTAPTFGGTVSNRKEGLKSATMRAYGNVSDFVNLRVTKESVQSVITKNIEKAEDKIKAGNLTDEEVSMTDTEAKNIKIRNASNETSQKLTETIRTNSETILKGFRKVKEEVVGDQEVSVTIRWDKDSDLGASFLGKKFK